jgi:hypothetical protein
VARLARCPRQTRLTVVGARVVTPAALHARPVHHPAALCE